MTDLVGRETEFNAIVDAWRRAGAGKPQLVFIQGDPGLGKTRLIDDLKRRFRFDRERAVVTRAFPGERTVPFSFLVSLIHALSRLPGATGVDANVVPTLLSIDPRLSGTFSGKPEAGSLFDVITRRSLALRELLAAVCDEAAVPILIDDYHWIDESSRSVLASALSRVGGLRLLVVMTSRSPLAFGVSEFETTPLSLKALSALDVENLIASMGVLPSDEDWVKSLVCRLTEVSSGNPLLVLTAIQQLMDGGALAIRDGRWITPNASTITLVTERIDPIGARLRALAPDQFHIVVACAVAGVPLPRGALARVGHDNTSSSAAVASLEQSGLIVSADDVVDLAHDAIGEKALQMADETTRHEAQRQLAAGLVDEPDPRSIELGIRLAVDVGAFDAATPSLSRLVRARGREPASPWHPSSPPYSAPRLVIRWCGGRFDRCRGGCGSSRGGLQSWRRRPRFSPCWDCERSSSARRRRTRCSSLLFTTIHCIPDTPRCRSESRVGRRLRSCARIGVDDTGHDAPRGLRSIRRPGPGCVDEHSVRFGGVDVTLAGVNGEIERLTHSRADEFPGSWSPDGKQAIIETSQFGDSGHKVVAILDLASRRIRPLTGSRHWESRARWSPDGTRIALIPILTTAQTPSASMAWTVL